MKRTETSIYIAWVSRLVRYFLNDNIENMFDPGNLYLITHYGSPDIRVQGLDACPDLELCVCIEMSASNSLKGGLMCGRKNR